MKFNVLDIVLMGLALRGLFIGMRRGILAELVLSLGMAASIITAVFFSSKVGEMIINHIALDIQISNDTVAWVILVFGISASYILAAIVRKLSHIFIQSNVDKALGAVLGGIRALILSGVVLFYFVINHSELVMQHTEESLIGNYLCEKVNAVYDVLKEKTTPAEVLKAGQEISEAIGSDSENQTVQEETVPASEEPQPEAE
jgi:uncharacterized membrane protein required for colicin V production